MSDGQRPGPELECSDRAGAEYWDGRGTPSSAPTGSSPGDRLRRFNARRMDHMLSALLGEVPSGARIIELGCAPGWMLHRLHRLRSDLCFSGVDYAAQGVRDARDMLCRAGIAAEVYEGDVRTFADPAGFDVVISCGLVEHFDEPAGIVAHHARIAGPGGLVVITVPNFRTALLGGAFRWLSPEGYATHNISVMSPDALRDLALQAGLVDVSAGGGGGPILYSTPRDRPGLLGRAYLIVAKAWNLFAAAMPEWFAPWHGHYWVRGRVPVSPER